MLPGFWPPLVLSLLAIPWILYGLGSYSLVNGDEAFYHSIAEAMVESGNWMRLEFTGEHRIYDTFMNAPLQYWARAALIAVFGSSYWTMRILSALFGVATVLMTYELTRYVSDRRSALLAGLILLTTFQFVYLHSARTGELEPIVSFLFVLIAWLFLRALEKGGGFALHHLCLALLVNVKLPTVIIPVAAELAYLVLRRGTGERLRSWLVTAAVMLPFAFSWHITQALTLPEGAWSSALGMMNQAGGRDVYHGGIRRLVYYASILLFGAFPYALVYPVALADLLRTRGSAEQRARLVALGFYAMSILAFFGFVSVGHPWYIIPVYPFLALFLGIWLSDLIAGRVGRGRLVVVAGVVVLLVWLNVGLTTFNPFAERARNIRMDTAWRSIQGVGAGIGVPLSLMLLGGGFAVFRRALGASSARFAGVGFACVLIGYAALRVSLPLVHVGHQSELASLRRQLDEAQEVGSPIRYPIPVQNQGVWPARFFFADDFEIVVTNRQRGDFDLYEKDDPWAVTRSDSHGRKETGGPP